MLARSLTMSLGSLKKLSIQRIYKICLTDKDAFFINNEEINLKKYSI